MSPRPKTDAKERVLRAASELFYRQGYHSTTVDQVIKLAKVSKPTVYSYFPHKEDLCLGYLEERTRHEIALMEATMKAAKTPRDRYLAIIRHAGDRIRSWDYRGCGFMNMLAEIPNAHSPIVQASQAYIEATRSLIATVVDDLKESSPEYAHLDVRSVPDAYYLCIAGAISTCQECRQDWPIESATKQVENLLRP